jgi:hypothetical protein
VNPLQPRQPIFTLRTPHDRRIVVRINSMSDAMQSVEDAQLEQLSCIAPAKRKGRQTSDVWQLFSTDESPQLLRSACCMHCKVEVAYMKKSERVKSHLLKCKSFITEMVSMDVAERPDWFDEEHSKRLKLSFSSRSGTSLKQSSIKAFLPPPLSKAELQKIEDNIALHYYISGSSFIRVEERHLLEAFKIARPDVVLPDRR